MITKYTYKLFYATKVTDKLTLECEFCHNDFSVIKRRIQSALKGKSRDKCNFCSRTCAAKSKTKFSELECDFCKRKFLRALTQIKKSKSDKHFCSKSCSAKFNRK